MFKRSKVKPEVDPYIARRYEDTAVCIHQDIKNGRGRYSYYAPWLEKMLERLPSAEHREKYSLIPKSNTNRSRQVVNAWIGEEAGTTGTRSRHEASTSQLHLQSPPQHLSESVSSTESPEQHHTLNQREREKDGGEGNAIRTDIIETANVLVNTTTRSKLCIIL